METAVTLTIISVCGLSKDSVELTIQLNIKILYMFLLNLSSDLYGNEDK